MVVISRWRKGGVRGTVESERLMSGKECERIDDEVEDEHFPGKFWRIFREREKENATFARLEFHSVMLSFSFSLLERWI